jgi:hypothetical protein
MLRRDGPQACCPPPPHPEPPQIRAGLPVIPRQLTGFPQYRRAMLHAIEGADALAGWRADSDHDLGVMLIEAWAYVLDVTGFYDALIANRAYLGTASDDAIAAQIVALTGYRPRPALVARVRLALEARGREAVSVPAGTGVRSQPFAAEKAQVFELEGAATVWPQRNRWPLAPVRPDLFDGVLRFAPNEGPDARAIIVARAGTLLHAARVAASDVRVEPDGNRYRVLTLDPPLPAGFTGNSLSAMTVATLALQASPSPLDSGYAVSATAAYLDALYALVQPNTHAVVEVNGTLHAVTLTSAGIHDHSQSVGSSGATATIPLSSIGYASIGTIPSQAAIRFHLVPKDAGRPMALALPEIDADDIRAAGWLADRTARLAGAPDAGEAFAIGARPRGVPLPGRLAEGLGPRYVPDAGGNSGPLETPVAILGNVVTAVRGETVSNEVVGSGDARIPSQRFRLAKKPLSWTEDAAAPSGRAPQITLRVDGIEWRYVDSFYGQAPEARLFTIEMAPDGTATIVGGDGMRGARFPSGVRNILASYRHGAGAAKPPPGSINQFARAAPSLARVVQPIDGWGGADAESAAEMRALAPAGALTLDRAVSLADFEAMIRGYSGIVNAAVSYGWDQALQDAVVTGWIIADAGDPSATLEAYLKARALPGLAVHVGLATRVSLPVFDIAIAAAPDRAASQVRADVRTALFDPKDGYLAPRNVPIAAPLFRSRLLAAIHAVPGVASVPSISLATGPMPKALAPGDGAWFDFLEHGAVL